MTDIRVLGIKLNNGDFAPLAWTDRDISNKELRRLVRKFKTDADFLAGAIFSWSRFYASLDEVKTTLPRI